MLIFRQHCLGRVALSPARGDGDGHTVSWYFQALFSGSFPWQFSVTLLRVRAAVAEYQPLSQNGVIAVLSPLSSSGLFNSVSVHAAENPAASWVVHPTASVPALTSRAGMSLFFACLKPPAAPVPVRAPELPLSVVHAHPGASVFSLVTRAFPGS